MTSPRTVMESRRVRVAGGSSAACVPSATSARASADDATRAWPSEWACHRSSGHASIDALAPIGGGGSSAIASATALSSRSSAVPSMEGRGVAGPGVAAGAATRPAAGEEGREAESGREDVTEDATEVGTEDATEVGREEGREEGTLPPPATSVPLLLGSGGGDGGRGGGGDGSRGGGGDGSRGGRGGDKGCSGGGCDG